MQPSSGNVSQGLCSSPYTPDKRRLHLAASCFQSLCPCPFYVTSNYLVFIFFEYNSFNSSFYNSAVVSFLHWCGSPVFHGWFVTSWVACNTEEALEQLSWHWFTLCVKNECSTNASFSSHFLKGLLMWHTAVFDNDLIKWLLSSFEKLTFSWVVTWRTFLLN